MPRQTVKMIYHPDRKRRVEIYSDGRGHFGFEEQHFSSDPLELCWVPVGKQIFSICDSAETAEREARGRVDWLNR